MACIWLAVAVIAVAAWFAMACAAEAPPTCGDAAGMSAPENRLFKGVRESSCPGVNCRSDAATTMICTAAALTLQWSQTVVKERARLAAVTASADRATTICSDTAQPVQPAHCEAHAVATLSAITARVCGT